MRVSHTLIREALQIEAEVTSQIADARENGLLIHFPRQDNQSLLDWIYNGQPEPAPGQPTSPKPLHGIPQDLQ